jgi:hypothetical protein
MRFAVNALRQISYFKHWITPVVLLFNVVVSGCGQKDSAENQSVATPHTPSHIYENQEPFRDWMRERFGNIVIIHPLQHPHQDKYEDFAKIFASLARQTCVFLKIEPQDSIVIYFYTGIGHALTVTQKEATFSDSYVIHFWFPSYYGPPIVKHLLPKWHKGESRHKFLKHGIIALLDGSGRNYHEMTKEIIDTGAFISLEKLSQDTTVNVDRERYQSAEAASFVDFIVYSYGIDELKSIYASRESFDKAVEEIFLVTTSELEKRWLIFVEAYAASKPPQK